MRVAFALPGGTLRRFFSSFPSGRPGAGLLILRLAIGTTAVWLGARFLAGTPDPEIVEWIGAVLAIVSGLSLVIGFLAPAFGAAVAMEAAAIALSHVPSVLSVVPCKSLNLWLFVVVASASLLLGPGAYSVDARLFGRREIVIPSRNRPSAL